jgi:hypothetical protein
MAKEQLEIPEDKDYAIRSQTPDEKAKWMEAEIPEYKIKLDLSETQKTELTAQVFLEFEALKNERKAKGLETAWKDRDAQYDGQLTPVENLDFAIDVRESKIKVDSVVRALTEAFLPDGGDMIDVSPRPETARNDGFAVAEKQQQFVDFAMDEEIKPEMSIRKIATSAAKKFVGIGKLCWSFKQEKRRREEHWEGKNVQVGTTPDGLPIVDNEGLRNFLNMYPDAPERYKAQVMRLIEGKSIDIVVQYKEIIKNNPELKYVKVEDFYVRNDCQYNDGLTTEHLIGERQRYTYWELKKMEEDGEFENVDALFNLGPDAENPGEEHKTKTYDVMEFTTYMKLNPSDSEETKVKCWFGEENECFLGAIVYPYYAIDTDYIGYWITTNDKGFYGDAESMMFDLRDTHIAQDALISLMLHSIYIRNVITPIVRSGSEAEQMFTDHEFKTGKPIVVDDLTDDVGKAMGFVQWPVSDTNGALVMLEKMKRIGSDVSRVSDLVTGGESNIDPNAPASKTIALLQQSGIGIKDYIRTFLPSFNIFAGNILQLYYQMSTEDRKYRIRAKSKQVTGKDIFETIRREEMIVKTNIQSRAGAFAFDKVNEKREAMAAYQLITQNPYTMRQPKVLYKALRVFMSTFGGQWKTMGETDMPSPEEFEKQQQAIAIQVIQGMLQKAMQASQTTGVAPDLRGVVEGAPEAITKAQSEEYDPRLIPKEEQAE